LNHLSIGAAALGGDSNVGRAGKIAAGERVGARGDLLGLALRDEISAGVARAWS